MTLTAGAIAQVVEGTVRGDPGLAIEGFGAIESAGANELTFAVDAKRIGMLARSRAGAVLVPESVPVPEDAAARKVLIVVADVQAAVAKLLGELAAAEAHPPAGVHPSAVVAPDAEIAPDAAIGPGVVIGAKTRIGAASVLAANVTVRNGVAIGAEVLVAEGAFIGADTVIGDRVRIGPNAVIGWDGFGYFLAGGVHHRIPHVGNVVLDDDVEIGACCCIDRAKFDSTRIAEGTKIDNLVQIAHNVQIGKGCLLAGQCGIAGSAKLGSYVVLGGNSGIRDNITLGDKVLCSAFAPVAQNVPDGVAMMGLPARPAGEQMRIFHSQAKLPDLLKRVKKLESRIESLERPADD